MTKTATTPAEAAPEEQPYYVLGAGEDASFLLPDNASCVPSQVQVLNDEAINAWRALTLAGAQARAAKDAVQQSAAIDRAADASAAAAGAPLPEERAETAATAALEQATRRLDAAQRHARDSQIALARGINKFRTPWLEEQSGICGAIKADLERTIATLIEQLAALEREGQILDGLTTFPQQGALSVATFGRPQPNAERFAEIAREAAATRVASTQGNMSDLVPRDKTHLIAALRLIIEKA